MACSLLPKPIQDSYCSLAFPLGLVLSVSLLSGPIQASIFPLLPGLNQATPGDQQAPRLEPGRLIERELAGGESHSYGIMLALGQYLQVVVDQRGIDVVVALFAPDGKKISEVDSPNGTAGPETVSA
jgi:hypothetical protein